MTSQQFLDLSTRVVRELKEWSEEATRRTVVPPVDLEELERVAAIIDRVTTNAIANAPDAR